MKDLEIRVDDHPGTLATLAEALGAAQVSLEGGGVFTSGGIGHAHFLIADTDAVAAHRALRAAGLDVVAIRDVLLTRLRQDVPGQLGALTAQLAAADVNITTQYSDHAGQLVLLVDNPAAARDILVRWERQ